MTDKKKRKKVYLTMDSNLYELFEKETTEKCIDKSLLLDSFVKEWLEKQK